MAYLAVDLDGTEKIFVDAPHRDDDYWESDSVSDGIEIPHGSIRKLIREDLTWENEPVELKEE